MKKNGFTLVEVLAVAVLLGVVATITVPIVKKTLKDSKQKLSEEQINLMEDALKNWASSNIFSLPEDNETIKITLGQLKQAGLLNIDVKNPMNNKCFSNESVLKIVSYNNSYIYEVDDIKNVECDVVQDAPIIKLKGDEVEYLSVGKEYSDLGFASQNINGEDITSSVTTTISGSGTTIDTTKKGTYIITYRVEDNGKVMSAIRNVIIK